MCHNTSMRMMTALAVIIPSLPLPVKLVDPDIVAAAVLSATISVASLLFTIILLLVTLEFSKRLEVSLVLAKTTSVISRLGGTLTPLI